MHIFQIYYKQSHLITDIKNTAEAWTKKFIIRDLSLFVGSNSRYQK